MQQSDSVCPLAVLDACQRLYETHRLITYPRSDCRYLPEEHFAERHNVLNAISTHCEAYQRYQMSFQLNREIAVGMIKVEAHHAIIPTAKNRPVNLTQEERNIYSLFAANI